MQTKILTNKSLVTLSTFLGIMLICVSPAHAMHIAEGILPASWAGLWFVLTIPFMIWGLRDLHIRSEQNPQFKSLVGLVGAAVFVFSCMPIPVPIAGNCSHPVGTGLAAILVGPSLAVVITSITLLLQALFLAHGGITTLGANIFAMGVVGGFVGYGVFSLARRCGASWIVAAFIAGMISDWATYTATSFVLASGLHTGTTVWNMFLGILVYFIPTQLPLGIMEGAVSAGAIRFISIRQPELITVFAGGR